MKSASACLCALALLYLAACGGPDVPRERRIDLIERAGALPTLPAGAAIEAPTDGDPASLTLRVGSALRFAVALPDAPLLVGRFERRGSVGPAILHVTLTDTSTREESIASIRIASDAREPGFDLRADLARWAGRFASIELRLEGGGGDEDEGAATRPADSDGIGWTQLEIHGAAAPASAHGSGERTRHDVLVIVLDSLRADRIEPYGAEGVATPNLARLARGGVTFETARANSSWTRPSVGALLSSQLPERLAIHDIDDAMPGDLPVLPTLLKHAGYHTVSASGTPMIAPDFGFARGFERVHDLWDDEMLLALGQPKVRARWIWNLVFESALLADPFFVYLHEVDPHSPYAPPPGFAEELKADYRGRRLSGVHKEITAVRQDPDSLQPAELAYLEGLYRAEIAAMDVYVGDLLDRLEKRGRLRDTLVVFTSDHGEEMMDHRSLGHGHGVYDELLRVPLIMHLDGILPAGARISTPVELIDVAPTILDLVGLEVPEAMRGRSLLPLVEGSGDGWMRPAIASADEPPHHSIVHRGWKLIRRPGHPGGAASSIELYQIGEDPGERTNRAAEQPLIAAALAETLDHELGLNRPTRAPTPGKLSPAIRANLEALGYLE